MTFLFNSRHKILTEIAIIEGRDSDQGSGDREQESQERGEKGCSKARPSRKPPRMTTMMRFWNKMECNTHSGNTAMLTMKTLQCSQRKYCNPHNAY